MPWMWREPEWSNRTKQQYDNQQSIALQAKPS